MESPDDKHVIGVDLGGTKLLAGVLARSLEMAHRERREIWGLDQAALLEVIVEEVGAARAAAPGPVAAVGFGIPCTFDSRTGRAVQAVNLPIADLPFAEVMEERLGLPVVVDNDGNCAALAEARVGAGRGSEHLVMLTLGTGIGGGMVLDGELYRGWIGGGAELGHMVVDMDGPPCQGNCPNWGCLESVASGTALLREAALRVARQPTTPLGDALEAGELLTGPLVTRLAAEGDPVARDAIEVIGSRLGVGLANIVNIFGPEVVVVGGGVIAAGEMLLAPARAVLTRRALAPGRDIVRVEAAALGAESGMVGAGILAWEAVG